MADKKLEQFIMVMTGKVIILVSALGIPFVLLFDYMAGRPVKVVGPMEVLGLIVCLVGLCFGAMVDTYLRTVKECLED